MSEWRTEEIFIVGKTYPIPHKRRLDTVCTGGVTRDGKWIRLWPISFRYLKEEQRYHMYSWLRAEVQKNEGDPRLESHTLKERSMEVIEDVRDWRERRRVLLPLLERNLEDLEVRNRADPSAVSLGLVEIEYVDFYWEETDRQWTTKQLSYMNQMQLIGPQRSPLEKIPYNLRLKFRCKGNPDCRGHDRSLFAWEYSEAFRQFRSRYVGEQAALDMLKRAFLEKVFTDKNDTYALVGTLRHHLTTWVIGEVFHPPKTSRLESL